MMLACQKPRRKCQRSKLDEMIPITTSWSLKRRNADLMNSFVQQSVPTQVFEVRSTFLYLRDQLVIIGIIRSNLLCWHLPWFLTSKDHQDTTEDTLKIVPFKNNNFLQQAAQCPSVVSWRSCLSETTAKTAASWVGSNDSDNNELITETKKSSSEEFFRSTILSNRGSRSDLLFFICVINGIIPSNLLCWHFHRGFWQTRIIKTRLTVH